MSLHHRNMSRGPEAENQTFTSTKNTKSPTIMQHQNGGHTAQSYVGTDVGKDHIDAFHRVLSGTKEKTRKRRFANTAKGHQAFITWIGAGPVRLCLEASGLVRHRRGHRALRGGEPGGDGRQGPRAAKQYGDSLLRRSKTDELDAELLADYAQRMPFETWEPPEAVFVELRAITRRI